MNPLARAAWLACLLALLVACSDADRERQASQKYYFLEALQQVEAGGRQLQSPGLDEQGMLKALATLDDGLRLAFQVEREFLDELDIRLGKNFERYFVKGVESYRLGIEAGDEEQQRDGLQRLARWAEFWSQEQAEIRARLESG